MKTLKERMLDFLSNKFIGLLIISALITLFVLNGIKDYKAYTVLGAIYIFYCLSNAMIKWVVNKYLERK